MQFTPSSTFKQTAHKNPGHVRLIKLAAAAWPVFLKHRQLLQLQRTKNNYRKRKKKTQTAIKVCGGCSKCCLATHKEFYDAD